MCFRYVGSRKSVPGSSEEATHLARLRLVSAYKHVGGVIPAGGGCARELTARVGAAWLAFRKHKRQVLASPIVSAKDKAVLFAALVEPALWLEHGRPVKTKSLCASRAPW